jgi:hypothetical protein
MLAGWLDRDLQRPEREPPALALLAIALAAVAFPVLRRNL